ncbi:hypothetical protein [Leptospira ognonensis]|uniref:hypothetical protein n=1 Tax=Leptospira ognonensis TaxID=2484945 RepID=UPI00108380FA|nr:hypothetical protein [Leptospira ognonensis]
MFFLKVLLTVDLLKALNKIISNFIFSSSHRRYTNFLIASTKSFELISLPLLFLNLESFGEEITSLL